MLSISFSGVKIIDIGYIWALYTYHTRTYIEFDLLECMYNICLSQRTFFFVFPHNFHAHSKRYVAASNPNDDDDDDDDGYMYTLK